MREILNWYQLLEGTGLTAIDFGPGSDYGTLTANIVRLAKGVTIAASESRIVSAAAAGFPAAVGSIETLVKPSWSNADGQSHFLWDTYGGSNRRFLLYKHSTGITILFTDGTNRGNFVYPWVAGTLYHVVLNWGNNQLYINKVLVNTFAAGGLGLGSSTLYIGDQNSGALYAWFGDLYYFITRGISLTLAEITTFYNYFVNQYT